LFDLAYRQPFADEGLDEWAQRQLDDEDGDISGNLCEVVDEAPSLVYLPDGPYTMPRSMRV
jgi:hypothetical protein